MRSARFVLLVAVIAALAGEPAREADSQTLEERAVAIERVVSEPDGARVVIGRDHQVNLVKLKEAVEGSQEAIERREEDPVPAASLGDGSHRRGSSPRAGNAGAGGGKTRR